VALSDKMRDKVAPYLEAGEQLRTAFPAQTGPSPYFMLLTTWVIFWTKYVVIVVTDRRVAVYRASRWQPTRPRREIASVPPDTPLADPSGLWGKVELGGVRYWVHRRYHGLVRAAAASPAPATD
jgi:hypothetical protein